MAVFASALAISGALRAASLDLCADEYLLLLATGQEIVAVSRLSRDPQESPLWQVARRYPAHNGRVEALFPSRPNLLVAVGAPGGRSTSTIAAKLGIKTLVLPYPNRPSDVANNLARLAKALGHPERALPWQARLTKIATRVPAPRDAIFLGGGGQSVASTGLSAYWMRLAGLRQRALAGGRATLEQLAVAPPRVILRSDYRSGQVSLGQRWLDHPLVQASAARTIATDGRRWTCGGPLMIEEIERLRRLG